MSEKIIALFGRDFYERFVKAINEARKLREDQLQQIKQFAVEHIRDSEDFHVRYDKWDVILVHVPSNVEVKKTSSGNWKVGLIWPGAGARGSISGPWISAFFSRQEDAEKVASRPGDYFLLVGKLRQREYAGGPTFSINVLGVIELEAESVGEIAVEQREEKPRGDVEEKAREADEIVFNL